MSGCVCVCAWRVSVFMSQRSVNHVIAVVLSCPHTHTHSATHTQPHISKPHAPSITFIYRCMHSLSMPVILLQALTHTCTRRLPPSPTHIRTCIHSFALTSAHRAYKTHPHTQGGSQKPFHARTHETAVLSLTSPLSARPPAPCAPCSSCVSLRPCVCPCGRWICPRSAARWASAVRGRIAPREATSARLWGPSPARTRPSQLRSHLQRHQLCRRRRRSLTAARHPAR